MKKLFTFTVDSDTYQASKRSGSSEPYSVHRVFDNGALEWGRYFKDPQALADYVTKMVRSSGL
tara:strand:- start:122 stop:310 length:189 start_codon:yes stop_codon:yes gene_type:complete